MKGLKSLLILSLSLLLTAGAFAQYSFPVINKDIFFSKIDQDTSARYFMVFTFVNYCHGVTEIPAQIKMMDSLTDHQTRYFLCQGSRGTGDRGAALEKMLKKNGIDEHKVYVIDDNQYKTRKGDPRKQAAAFRDDLCSACRHSMLSGVFYILLDKEKNILFSGFALNPGQLSAMLTSK